MFLVSSCSCICPVHWSQVLSREWRCSWSSADRQCSNYIWVIKNFIAYWGAAYIRGFTVVLSVCNIKRSNGFMIKDQYILHPLSKCWSLIWTWSPLHLLKSRPMVSWWKVFLFCTDLITKWLLGDVKISKVLISRLISQMKFMGISWEIALR